MVKASLDCAPANVYLNSGQQFGRHADGAHIGYRGPDQLAEESHHLLSEKAAAISMRIVPELYRVERSVIALDQLRS
jgi:ribosome-binding factor A